MKRRIREYGVVIGKGTPGARNAITDVPGVTVGHTTLKSREHRTGATVILPCADNMFSRKLTAASFVMNGFGKTAGLVQVDELGCLETPIALTNTLNVGLVMDAMVEYMAERCQLDHVEMHSINSVVGECNDARFNAITKRPVQKEDVFHAIQTASADFDEGNVGAGTGMVCFGLKGGIGSSSRVIEIGGRQFTVGILVQCNHGCLERLRVGEKNIGEAILEIRNRPEVLKPDQGSIMVILATDLPLMDRQIRRVLRRCCAGLAHMGSYFGHGSGDVMIGFTTANRIPSPSMPTILAREMLCESALETVFREAADATEEAVLNALVSADPDVTRDGETIHSLREYLDAGIMER
ncbi:MAG: P1 family peptidase [Clostridia bacterium]|nr:P1 family peptidase [Clostridia bacterium]